MSTQARKMIRQKELEALLGVSTSTLWRLVGTKNFPKGKKVTKKVTAYFEDEILEWQNSLADSEAVGME